MIEPNTDALTLTFAALIVFVPIVLHTVFGERRQVRTDRETNEEPPECEECGDPSDHSVPNAPGMGNRYYCEECCPRCNFGSEIGGSEET